MAKKEEVKKDEEKIAISNEIVVQGETHLAKLESDEIELGELTEGFDPSVNLEDLETVRLPEIEMAHGKTQVFVMPNGDTIKDFRGVILDSNPTNSYWIKGIVEGAPPTRPDCCSYDTIKPDVSVSEPFSQLCATCPKARMIDGKVPCNSKRRIHILFEGDLLPHRLTIPYTSIKRYEDYMTTMTNKRYPKHYVFTNFSLVREKNPNDFYYSELVLSWETPISSKKMKNEIDGMLKNLKEQMKKEEILSNEGHVSPDTSDNMEGTSQTVSADEINFDDIKDVPDETPGGVPEEVVS